MEMQRKERLNEKESREARKTARRKSVEVWATDCERAVEPINRADFMSGFDDGWLSAIKYASQQRWVEVADGVPEVSGHYVILHKDDGLHYVFLFKKDSDFYLQRWNKVSRYLPTPIPEYQQEGNEYTITTTTE